MLNLLLEFLYSQNLPRGQNGRGLRLHVHFQMVQTEQAAQQSSPGGHWERYQSVDTLFSSSLHMFPFSFQCSFVCPQPHTHSSGISIASRSETGMAKCEGCLGYS